MPVIPTLSSFPRGPDLVGAASSADQLRQRAVEAALNYRLQQDRLAQEAQADAMRIQVAREQIEARKVENQMRLEAAQKTNQMNALRKQHEAELTAAYREAQLGLSERRADAAEEAAAWRIDESARDMAAFYEGERIYAELEPQVGAEEARRQQILRTGRGPLGAALSGPAGEKEMTASEKNLRYKELTRQDKSIRDKYYKTDQREENFSPTDKSALEKIRKDIETLLQPVAPVPSPRVPTPWTPTATNAPAPVSIPPGITNAAPTTAWPAIQSPGFQMQSFTNTNPPPTTPPRTNTLRVLSIRQK